MHNVIQSAYPKCNLAIPTAMAARKGLEDLPYRPATIVAVSDVQGKSSSDGRVPIKAVLSTLRKQGEILGHLHPCPREVAERYRLFTDGAKDPILLVAFKSIKVCSLLIPSSAYCGSTCYKCPLPFDTQSVRPAIAALHRRYVSTWHRKKGILYFCFSFHMGLPSYSCFAALKCSRRVGRTRLDDPLWARQLGGQGKQLKKWRVIIRNVNFRANERAIEKAVERVVAFPWEVNLPKTCVSSPFAPEHHHRLFQITEEEHSNLAPLAVRMGRGEVLLL